MHIILKKKIIIIFKLKKAKYDFTELQKICIINQIQMLVLCFIFYSQADENTLLQDKKFWVKLWKHRFHTTQVTF